MEAVLITKTSGELNYFNIPHHPLTLVNTLVVLWGGAKPWKVLNVKKGDIQHIPYDQQCRRVL